MKLLSTLTQTQVRYILLHLNKLLVMKKILLLTVVLFYASGLFAQDGGPLMQNNGQSRYEQIQSAKIAFFTSELELTPKEAAEFWPVYNKLWKAREIAHRRIQISMRTMCKALSEDSKTSDSELKAMVENYVDGFNDDGLIQRDYLDQFYKILPIKKIAKLYKAEEDFRVRMIHQLRKGGGMGERLEK